MGILRVCFLRFTLFILCCLCIQSNANWILENNKDGCSFIYQLTEQSNGARAPVLVWLGSPSASPQVSAIIKSNSRPMPMPSIWNSFVHVMYITDCRHSNESDVEHVVRISRTVINWHIKYETKVNGIYISGDQYSTKPELGIYAASVAEHLLAVHYPVKGIWISNWGMKLQPIQGIQALPWGKFVSPLHALLTGGSSADLRFKLQQAQKCVCSASLSGVQLLLGDAHFQYVRRSTATSADEMFEYMLSHVVTHDACYPVGSTLDQLLVRISGDSTDGQTVDLTHAILPTVSMSDKQPFTTVCATSQTGDVNTEDELARLMRLNKSIHILLTTYTYASAKPPFCSFYNGIYEADALEFRSSASQSSDVNSLFGRFNAVALNAIVELTSSSAAGSSVHHEMLSVGVMQDSGAPSDNRNPVESQGARLVWLQLDSRNRRLNLTNFDCRYCLSESSALDVLQRFIASDDEEDDDKDGGDAGDLYL
jgi:hypothetical protein